MELHEGGHIGGSLVDVVDEIGEEVEEVEDCEVDGQGISNLDEYRYRQEAGRRLEDERA